MMRNDEPPTAAASEAVSVPAAEPASAAPAAEPTKPVAGLERKKLWSAAEVWLLGAFSIIGLIGFIATFVLVMLRAPNAPVQRTLTAAEIQRLTGPAGERGPVRLGRPGRAARPAMPLSVWFTVIAGQAIASPNAPMTRFCSTPIAARAARWLSIRPNIARSAARPGAEGSMPSLFA